jgi:hypothetical protein
MIVVILHEFSDFFGDRLTTLHATLTEASPAISESLVLPDHDDARTDKLQGRLSAGPPPREPDPEQAISGAGV